MGYTPDKLSDLECLTKLMHGKRLDEALTIVFGQSDVVYSRGRLTVEPPTAFTIPVNRNRRKKKVHKFRHRK